MYRNSEGYADPTAGRAFAHIEYETRRRRRKEKQKHDAMFQNHLSAKKSRRKQKHKKMSREYWENWGKHLHWTLAWTNPDQANKKERKECGSHEGIEGKNAEQ